VPGAGNNPVNASSGKLLARKRKKRKERGGWRQTITVLWDRERISEKAQVIVVPSAIDRNIQGQLPTIPGELPKIPGILRTTAGEKGLTVR
jgi:hypothetical protein